MRTASWVFLLWFCAAVLWIAVTIAYAAGWRINHTESLPLGLWRVHSVIGPILRGQIVSFCPPDEPIFQEARNRGYVGNGICPGGYEPLLKPVAAVAGDVVEIDTKGIRVNGVSLRNSKIVAHDQQGRKLPTLASRYHVQAGMLWMISVYNSQSFDSRYFGAISTKQVLAIAAQTSK